MTDHWYHRVLPAPSITPGYILYDSESNSSRGSNGTTPNFSPLRVVVQQAAHKKPCFRSKDALTRDLILRSFGIGRQSTYYVHENSFSSDPGSLAFSKIAIDITDAMVRLANIDQGLQKRGVLVKNNRSKLDLNMLIYREGPLFIESHSLAEYAMDASQEFLQILTSLRDSRQLHYRRNEESSTSVVKAITGVYCRILSFYELFLEHLTARTERLASEPVIPIPGLMFNGMPLNGPCAQGVLFCSTCLNLLGKLEHVLGLTSDYSRGLLSPKEIDVLLDTLVGSTDLAFSEGIMRPEDVKKLFVQAANVLERLYLVEAV